MSYVFKSPVSCFRQCLWVFKFSLRYLCNLNTARSFSSSSLNKVFHRGVDQCRSSNITNYKFCRNLEIFRLSHPVCRYLELNLIKFYRNQSIEHYNILLFMDNYFSIKKKAFHLMFGSLNFHSDICVT